MIKNFTKAMVMSAGMGTRLEPLTLQVPKPLVPICNKPVMDILFENLAEIGINNLICNTYYLAEQIINRYKSNNYGINFNYIIEDTLSGTAGGLKKCQFFFDEGEDFLVLSADGLTNADIKHGIDVHKKSNAIATIGIKSVKQKEDVSHFGVVVTDKGGFITEFQEKPSVEAAKSNCINTGIYIFNYEIFNYIPDNTFYDFAKDVFPKLLEDRQINTFLIEDYWSDIGTLEQYKQSVKDTFEGVCKFKHESVIKTLRGAYISATPILNETEFIGYSTIGSGCRIGRNVTIENSIIWDNVEITGNTHIKNCIIASNAVIDKSICDAVVGCSRLISI